MPLSWTLTLRSVCAQAGRLKTRDKQGRRAALSQSAPSVFAPFQPSLLAAQVWAEFIASCVLAEPVAGLFRSLSPVWVFAERRSQ